MIFSIPDFLKRVALAVNVPLYLVGGSVRGVLLGGALDTDLDLAADLSAESFVDALKSVGLEPKAVYKRTGTVMFGSDGYTCEFTSFRVETYPKGGAHAPNAVSRTGDIVEDARRRDFTANAVYYDIKKGELVDPLGGATDVENRVLKTVKEPSEVFCDDGLRLLRLARFAGELGFTPSEETLAGAREYKENIRAVSGERIYAELQKMLDAPERYPYSGEDAAFRAFSVLKDTGVLEILFPTATWDEESLKPLLFAPPSARFCALTAGYGWGKTEELESVLTDLRFPKTAVKKTVRTVRAASLLTVVADAGATGAEIRSLFVEYADVLENVLSVMKAVDGEDGERYQKVSETLAETKRLGAPLSLKELSISGKDLRKIGLRGKEIGEMLAWVLSFAIQHPEDCSKEQLLWMAIWHRQELEDEKRK